MKKVIIIIAIFIGVSQYAQELPDIIPPSPEATSLGKYVDIPVSHYTGVPNINIPIYDIDLDGMSIPINLSYHAKGIRVEEIASRVGIGWALNSGGVITRQIRGAADEYVSNGVIGYLRSDFYESFFTSEATREQVYAKNLLNEQDLYPDNFMFNFMGYSGKFIFDQRTKMPIVQHFSDIKIEPLWPNDIVGELPGWIVTTPNGYKFYFGVSADGFRSARDKENVLGSYVYNTGLINLPVDGSHDPYSAWYLLDVVSPKGNSVVYTYETESPIYCRRSYDKFTAGTNMVSCHFSEVSPIQNQVKEISFDLGKVIFKGQNTEREDLDNAYALDEIEIKDKNNNAIKSFKFDYIYSTSTANNMLATLDTFDPKAKKRLFLDAVATYDDSGTSSLPPYKMYYNSVSLPGRFSNSQDIWGYYNGKNNGSFLTFLNYGTTTVDRAVDTTKSQAGMLRKIKVPTGGSMNYEYEHNKSIPPSYFEDLLSQNSNPIVTKSKGIFKNPIFYKGNVYESDLFTIGEHTVIDFVDSNIGISPFDLCDPNQATTTCPYRVELIGGTSPIILNYGTHEMNIPSGDYIIRVTPKNIGSEDPLDWETSYFSVFLRWQENIANQDELLFTSGNRIKKTILEDENGSAITKEYSYINPLGVSSGKVFSLPSYYFKDEEVGGVFIINRKFGARPGSPLTYEQGNHEGYSHVTEYHKANGVSIGKTSYSFTTFEDTGDFYKHPYHLATDNEWMRGKILEIKQYKNSSVGYSLVKSVKNEYHYGDLISPLYLMYPMPSSATSYEVYQNTNINYIASFIVFADQDGTLGDSDEHNEYKTFYLTGGTLNLHSTEEKNYEDSGILSQFTNYEYEYDKHYQISATEKILNNQDVLTSRTYYPTDKNELSGLSVTASTAIDNLVATHQVTTPIQVETTLKSNAGTVLSESLQRTNYKTWSNGISLPEQVQSSKNNNSLEERIVFLKYDSEGNPLEVSKAKGTHISYVYGYDKKYPVAKIENATYAQVVATGVNLSILDDVSSTEAAKTVELNKIRNGLSSAMVSTYTYDPLIGVTSMTDPRGYTIYYTYDNFNRLKEVRDQNNKLLSENQYHYKNQ